MSFSVTLAVFAAFLGMAVFSGWRGARPPDLARGPRMVPWRSLMLLSVVACIFLSTHLINLAGFDTSAAGPRF